jgi:uncharacterized protein (DUF488 family)
MTDQPQILTIGHSTHSIDQFIALLEKHRVTKVADVRSQPFSRYAPQFNKRVIEQLLRQHRIKYWFLGAKLGARSDRPECYVDGRVQYGRLAQTEEFRAGLVGLLNEAQSERLAVMCTEKDPLDCHRTVLVARRLADEGARVSHIRADGSLESHSDAMDRLMERLGMQPSLLHTRDEQVAQALEEQEARIAYVDTELAALSQR